MATSATASINTTVKGSLSDTGLDIGQASFSFNESFNTAFSNGAGANQVKQIWADIRTIAASGNDDINLTSLTNALGAAIVFTSIKGLMIKANAANTNNLIIGDAATPFASMFGDPEDTLIVPPGGLILLANPSAAGYAVTASTNHLLRITNGNSGTTVTYQIFLFGATA
jgi:hypothetical protein